MCHIRLPDVRVSERSNANLLQPRGARKRISPEGDGFLTQIKPPPLSSLARTLCSTGHWNWIRIPSSGYPSIDGQHDSGQRAFSRFAQARLGSPVNQIDRPSPSALINVLDDGIFYAAILHKKKLQQEIAI
jgi:hypothetical protein